MRGGAALWHCHQHAVSLGSPGARRRACDAAPKGVGGNRPSRSGCDGWCGSGPTTRRGKLTRAFRRRVARKCASIGRAFSGAAADRCVFKGIRWRPAEVDRAAVQGECRACPRWVRQINPRRRGEVLVEARRHELGDNPTILGAIRAETWPAPGALNREPPIVTVRRYPSVTCGAAMSSTICPRARLDRCAPSLKRWAPNSGLAVLLARSQPDVKRAGADQETHVGVAPRTAWTLRRRAHSARRVVRPRRAAIWFIHAVYEFN